MRERVEITRERSHEGCEVREKRRHEKVEDDESCGKHAHIDDDDRDNARDLALREPDDTGLDGRSDDYGGEHDEHDAAYREEEPREREDDERLNDRACG